jgi:hypothetical protein
MYHHRRLRSIDLQVRHLSLRISGVHLPPRRPHTQEPESTPNLVALVYLQNSRSFAETRTLGFRFLILLTSLRLTA